jgi:hypothetical protein
VRLEDLADIDSLAHQMTYYWKVQAQDDHGATSPSELSRADHRD